MSDIDMWDDVEHAPKGPEYVYKAKIVRVVDGDTVQAELDMGFSMFVNITIRLRNINAPEKKTPEGKVAKDWLVEHLAGMTGPLGVPCLVRTHKLRSGGEDMTFARYVADVWLEDGSSLQQAIVDAGQAVRVRKS